MNSHGATVTSPENCGVQRHMSYEWGGCDLRCAARDTSTPLTRLPDPNGVPRLPLRTNDLQKSEYFDGYRPPNFAMSPPTALAAASLRDDDGSDVIVVDTSSTDLRFGHTCRGRAARRASWCPHSRPKDDRSSRAPPLAPAGEDWTEGRLPRSGVTCARHPAAIRVVRPARSVGHTPSARQALLQRRLVNPLCVCRSRWVPRVCGVHEPSVYRVGVTG